ncbi:MAG: nicotinate-nucleotide adenylyltransferase [Gammaproteobacteria bacterium]|nr:nicotinate-nucleotide adenylyltransferase [Gammaproteobacteria bacterium]
MIGIFGGTFDPIHYGHIKPALSVKQTLNLTQIRFIPNGIPPHRTVPWLNAEQRLSLLQTALKKYPDVVIDQRELHRDGPSYMIDTLQSLKKDYPDTDICLIVGMDAFFGITRWHQWKQLFDLCHLVVTTRPGFEQDTIAERMSADDYRFLASRMTRDVKALTPRETGKILLQSVPQLDISSTQIRAKLLDGEDVSQWMPVEAYQKLRGFIDDD